MPSWIKFLWRKVWQYAKRKWLRTAVAAFALLLWTAFSGESATRSSKGNNAKKSVGNWFDFNRGGDKESKRAKSKDEKDRRSSAIRQIISITDGDTLVLDGNEKVRLLGVDTPEKYAGDKLKRDTSRSLVKEQRIKILGQKASDFTNKLCRQAGNRCRLRYDRTQGKTDRYGRTLAYVDFLDGSTLNEELLRQGYATAFRKYEHGESKRYLELEREAKKAKRGLWRDRDFQRLAFD